MTNRILGMALLGCTLAAASPATAQMLGMPVYFSPKGGTGITLNGDFGRVTSQKIGTTTQSAKPTAIGGRVYLGLPIITLGVGASVYDPKVLTQRNETQFMGSAAFKILGGPLVPLAVSLQAGAGYLKVGTGTGASKLVTVPIGLGFALNIPTPGASLEPWVAGRMQINASTFGTSSSSRIGYGVSGGLSLGLPIGLGAHLGIDWAKFGSKLTSTIILDRFALTQFTVGVGVHYMIRMPGLPGVPIVPGV